MSFEDTLRKSLTPELFTSVMDQLGDDFDFDLVPRSRLNKVIKQRNTLREQLAEGSHPQGSNSSAEDDTDDANGSEPGGSSTQQSKPVDVEKLKQQWLKEQGDAVRAVKIQYAALEKLRSVEAIDPDLIWKAGLIDQSKLTIEDSGAVQGLDEQIEELKKTRSKLFGSPKQNVTEGTGKNNGDDGFVSVKTREDFLKLSTDQQMAFKKANPEVFKTFLQF